MSEIDKSMRDLEKKRSEKLAKKSECDEVDDEIGKSRREVLGISKDIQSMQKQINAIENKMEQKRGERYLYYVSFGLHNSLRYFYPVTFM